MNQYRGAVTHLDHTEASSTLATLSSEFGNSDINKQQHGALK